MDLAILKSYFDACSHAEQHLQESWPHFHKLPAYSFYKLLAPQSQHKIDASHIKQFIQSFNWQSLLINPKQLESQQSYKIHSLTADMTEDQLLDYGLDLFVTYWGSQKLVNFDQFSWFLTGQHQLPIKDKQVPFGLKKELFQALIKEVQNLLDIETYKKIVYYEYKNLSDLFETVTNTSKIDVCNVERLFLSFSQRKSQKQIDRICKRAKIPWDFNTFLSLFKRNAENNKGSEMKIHYSSARKDKSQLNDKAYTTPRKQKYIMNQSSTKVTKLSQVHQDIYTTPKKQKSSIVQIKSVQRQKGKQLYLYTLASILTLEEEFVDNCCKLVNRKDFDLQLVYQQYGKRFEKILIQRYGICNFTAFIRFIVPREFENRYLAFIRYQANNRLTQETQILIEDLLDKYEQKQEKIDHLWKGCDKQLFMRYFCLPSEEHIRSDKLRQYFTSRETKLILQRLDPDKRGRIPLQALN